MVRSRGHFNGGMWVSCEAMRVLVTGAAGNVGGVVASHLAAAGFEVIGTDRVEGAAGQGIRVVDLLGWEGVLRVMEGCLAVVHCGNHPHARVAAPQVVYGENCTMNGNVFQAAVERGVKKIVFCSSIQVINGDRVRPEAGQAMPRSMLKYLPLDSQTPVNARNVYSQSKVAGERLLEQYVAPRGLECVALRLPWVVGKWKGLRVVGGMMELPFYLDEAGAAIYVEDVAGLVEACLRAALPGYRVYLPSMKRSFWEARVLVERVFEGVALRTPVEELERRGSLVDVSQITRETGWVAKY